MVATTVLVAVVLTDEMVLLVLVTVLLNGAFDAVVVAWLAGRRSQKALERWIAAAASGDEQAQETLGQLALFFVNWVATAKLKTGKKIKQHRDSGELDTEGNPLIDVVEIEEELTPLDMVGRTVGNYALMKARGAAGGTKAQIGRVLGGMTQQIQIAGFTVSDAAIQSAYDGQYLPLLLELSPQVKNKGKDNISSGGATEWK